MLDRIKFANLDQSSRRISIRNDNIHRKGTESSINERSSLDMVLNDPSNYYKMINQLYLEHEVHPLDIMIK